MQDYMIRATAAGGQVRAFAAATTGMAEEARRRHGTSPTATAALGRMLTAGAMMGAMMEGEGGRLTLQTLGDGPVGSITVTAGSDGKAKGFASHPEADVPPKRKGKLDVGALVGKGILRVMRDTGSAEPYAGAVALRTGEIGDDIAYYFAQSEQVPTAAGLGVLVGTGLSVEAAGGFIVQMMPGASESAVQAVEQNIAGIGSITGLLTQGITPEGILERALSGLPITFHGKLPVSFHCGCSRERAQKALASLCRADLEEMIADGEPIEITCHFCGEKYTFQASDLEQIISQ